MLRDNLKEKRIFTEKIEQIDHNYFFFESVITIKVKISKSTILSEIRKKIVELTDKLIFFENQNLEVIERDKENSVSLEKYVNYNHLKSNQSTKNMVDIIPKNIISMRRHATTISINRDRLNFKMQSINIIYFQLEIKLKKYSQNLIENFSVFRLI